MTVLLYGDAACTRVRPFCVEVCCQKVVLGETLVLGDEAYTKGRWMEIALCIDGPRGWMEAVCSALSFLCCIEHSRSAECRVVLRERYDRRCLSKIVATIVVYVGR